MFTFRRNMVSFLFIILSTILFSQNLAPFFQNQINEHKKKILKFQQDGNKSQEANHLNKIAYIYWENHLHEKAIENFSKSLQINREINNRNAIQVICNNIGMIYADIGNDSKAIEYLTESLSMKKQSGNKAEIASQLLNISNVLHGLNKYEQSNKYIDEALEIALNLNNLKLVRSCYGAYADNYKNLGNNELSFKYINLATSIDKKVHKEKEKEIKSITHKAVAEKIETEKALEKKSEQLKLVIDSLDKIGQIVVERNKYIDLLNQEKKNKELELEQQKTEAKNERLVRNMLLGGISFTLILMILIFKSYREKSKANTLLKKQKEEISMQKDIVEETSMKLQESMDKIYEQNMQISAGINYAKNIQNAILPEISTMKKNFPDSFVYLRSCNVVSGDFYWFKELKQNGSNKFIVAAVDCTGHGVPGAFMSMIGVNLLNEIVNRHFLHDNITIHSDLLLYELRKEIRKSLQQEKTNNRDGMDISLCIIDTKTGEIEFSGAYNPLYYIQNNNLQKLNGDKIPIGGILYKEEDKYTRHILKINEPADIYIFSDGYIDQLGGKDYRKFSSKRFKELLVKNHSMDFEEQAKKLDENLKEWKGKSGKQTDDILIIGFKMIPENYKGTKNLTAINTKNNNQFVSQ